jgi:hypothetical protein
VVGALYVLGELQGLPVTEVLAGHSARPGDDVPQIILDTTLRGVLQPVQDTRDIGPVPTKRLPRVGRLGVSHGVGVETEDVDTGEAFEDRLKDPDARCRDQVEPLLTRGRHDGLGLLRQLPATNLEVSVASLALTRGVDTALLPGDPETAVLDSADLESARTREVRPSELQVDTEVIRMTGGSATYLRHPATAAESLVKGSLERFGEQPQRVEEIALTRTVGAHQKKQIAELDVGLRDASVVLQLHPGERESVLLHGLGLSGSRVLGTTTTRMAER